MPIPIPRQGIMTVQQRQSHVNGFSAGIFREYTYRKEKLATLSRGTSFIPEKDFPIEGQAFAMAVRIWINLSILESMTSLVFTASFNVNSSLLRNRTG